MPHKETTIDELAMMVQKGFESMKDEFDSVKNEVDEIKDGMKTLERGQEDIKLRLDNVPYRFEMKEHKTILKRHDRRIGRLETKVFPGSYCQMLLMASFPAYPICHLRPPAPSRPALHR